jgi:hypothetical protein
LFVLIVNQSLQIPQYHHTRTKKGVDNGWKIYVNKLTLTTRFFKFLFTSPLAFVSNKLNRLGFSQLTSSFFLKAKLDRRPLMGGKSAIDERRRNDERGSGCLNILILNFKINN